MDHRNSRATLAQNHPALHDFLFSQGVFEKNSGAFTRIAREMIVCNRILEDKAPLQWGELKASGAPVTANVLRVQVQRCKDLRPDQLQALVRADPAASPPARVAR